jgi:hypothetical protein
MRYDWDFYWIAIVCAASRKANGKHGAWLTVVLLFSLGCLAQQPSATPATAGQPIKTGAVGNRTATIPAGTGISLQVMHPIATRLASVGDSIDLQVTTPVSVGDQVLIPPGTYVKGVLDKLTEEHDRTELRIYMNSLVWPNGYALAVTNDLEVVTTIPGSIYEHVDYDNPGHGKAFAVVAGSTLGGMAIGALVGGSHSSSSTVNFPPPPPGFPIPPPLPPLPNPSSGFGRAKGLVIGGAIGSVAGFVVAATMLHHDRNVVLDVGTPAQLVLENPITVDANRATESANEKAPPYRPNQIVMRGGCAPGTGIPGTAGTAATPDTVIPGTPATPPTVIPGAPGMPDTVIPGSPGTPDTVIPGTPGTPGTAAVPCVPVP